MAVVFCWILGLWDLILRKWLCRRLLECQVCAQSKFCCYRSSRIVSLWIMCLIVHRTQKLPYQPTSKMGKFWVHSFWFFWLTQLRWQLFYSFLGLSLQLVLKVGTQAQFLCLFIKSLTSCFKWLTWRVFWLR